MKIETFERHVVVDRLICCGSQMDLTKRTGGEIVRDKFGHHYSAPRWQYQCHVCTQTVYKDEPFPRERTVIMKVTDERLKAEETNETKGEDDG